MPIILSCKCGRKLRVKDEVAGKRIRCPGCGEVLLAPVAVSRPLSPSALPFGGAGEADGGRQVRASAVDASEADTEVAQKAPARPQSAKNYWPHPDSTDTLVALSNGALYVATLSEEELKAAEAQLDDGQPAARALKEWTTIIPLDAIQKAQSNLHTTFIDITWKEDDSKETTETNISCADKESRDEIITALQNRLGPDWKRKVLEFNRLRASWAPLVWIGVFAFVTFASFMAAIHSDEDAGSGRTRVARVRSGVQWLFYLVLEFVGPIGVVVLGVLFMIPGVIWLVLRLRKPPIMVSLTPR